MKASAITCKAFVLTVVLACSSAFALDDSDRKPKRIITHFWFRVSWNLLGPSADLNIDREGNVSYCYCSAPHTGSGGEVHQGKLRIEADRAEKLLDQLIELRLEDHRCEIPFHHSGLYCRASGEGVRIDMALLCLSPELEALLLPLLKELHPGLWKKGMLTEQALSAESTCVPREITDEQLIAMGFDPKRFSKKIKGWIRIKTGETSVRVINPLAGERVGGLNFNRKYRFVLATNIDRSTYSIKEIWDGKKRLYPRKAK